MKTILIRAITWGTGEGSAETYILETYQLPNAFDINGSRLEDAGDSWYQPISIFEQIAQASVL